MKKNFIGIWKSDISVLSCPSQWCVQALADYLLLTFPLSSVKFCFSGVLFTEQFRLFFVLTALWSLLAPSQKLPHLLTGIPVNNSKPIHCGYSWPALQDGNAVPMAQCCHTCGDACTHFCTCRLHTVYAPLRTWDVPQHWPSFIYNSGKSMAEDLLGRKSCWISMHRISLCVYDCLGIWLWRV